MQGLLLAKRLYARGKAVVNLSHVPTTVFTPLEYGSIGFSEETALATFGEANIEVHHMQMCICWFLTTFCVHIETCILAYMYTICWPPSARPTSRCV